jgi:LuxR family maltose regulon positive regulatory protein
MATMFASPRRTPTAWARIEPFLVWAEQGFEDRGRREQLGEAWELHAELDFFQDDLAHMLVLAEQATPLLSTRSLMYPTNRIVQGVGELLAGNLVAAWPAFLEGRRRSERLGSKSSVFAGSLLLGEICRERGELRLAARYYRQALADAQDDPQSVEQQLMTATGEREPFFESWAYQSLARLFYEWNDLATAEQALTQAYTLGEDLAGAAHALASGGFVRIHLLQRRGETAEALRLLETWERRTRSLWTLRALHASQARLQLAMGNLPAVESWARARENDVGFPVGERERELPYVQREEEALLLVRLFIARRQPQAALQELAQWNAWAEAKGRALAVLEMLILEALAHWTNRALPQARETALHALRLAQPEQYQRLFLDEGQTMAALVKSAFNAIQERTLADYARRLLDAFEQERANAPAAAPAGRSPRLDPLTPQEQRVLRLLAEGASNQQIATRLVISLATAKKHVANILGKLGAVNRTQAVAHARAYSLL